MTFRSEWEFIMIKVFVKRGKRVKYSRSLDVQAGYVDLAIQYESFLTTCNDSARGTVESVPKQSRLEA